MVVFLFIFSSHPHIPGLIPDTMSQNSYVSSARDTAKKSKGVVAIKLSRAGFDARDYQTKNLSTFGIGDTLPQKTDKEILKFYFYEMGVYFTFDTATSAYTVKYIEEDFNQQKANEFFNFYYRFMFSTEKKDRKKLLIDKTISKEHLRKFKKCVKDARRKSESSDNNKQQKVLYHPTGIIGKFRQLKI